MYCLVIVWFMLAAEKHLIKKKNLSPIGIKLSAPKAYTCILLRYRYNPHEVKIWDAVTDMTLIEYKGSVVTLYK